MANRVAAGGLVVLLMEGLAVNVGAEGRFEASYQQGWPALTWDSRRLTCSLGRPAAIVTLDDRRAPEEAGLAISEARQASYRLPQGLLTDSLDPFPRLPRCVVRRLIFENTSDRSVDLTGAEFRLAFAAPEDAPHWQVQSFGMVECAPGGPTLCVAFTSDEDPWRAELVPERTQPKAATSPAGPSQSSCWLAAHFCDAVWRLPPGGKAVIGSQYIWVVEGGLEEARATAQDWYDAVGLTVADDGPDWLRDCVLYQACAGGSVDSRFSDTGGFEPFSRQLDYIADLGCNAFWLMSVLTHKDLTGGWNLYDPLRYDQIDPAYGGEEGLTRLVEAMRTRGFRILNELVPHGGCAPVAIEHPEWWTYGRDGQRSRGFGQGLDYSAPGWQEQIRRTIRWLTANWGFDGYRVDVADGYGLNWQSPTNGPHVSLSTLAGSIGMLRAIREGALQGGARQPALLPETIEARPEYARWGQVDYGFRLIFFLEEIQPARRPPAELRDRLRDFFERERGALPRSMISLRALNNHDTVVEHGRADRRFGVGLMRALTGVCTVVEGVPMIYQEQEVGSYDYFRRLFWARRRVPEMRRGKADYLGVQGPPEVFAVLRTGEEGEPGGIEGNSGEGGKDRTHAIGLVNLSWQSVDGHVELPAGVIPAAGAVLYDAVSGRRLRIRGNRFRWRLAPYETAILRVGRPPEGKTPPERHRSASHSRAGRPARPIFEGEATATGGRLQIAGLDLTLAATDLHLESRPPTHPLTNPPTLKITASASEPGKGELSLQVLGVDRWLVETVTGLYEDRLLRRHYAWPEGLYRWDPSIVWGYEPYNLYQATLPAGRQWQSAVAPLSPEGRIAFAGPDGKGFMVTGLDINAANIILTDRSEEPDPEPYGLTLRFLASDTALNPLWTPGYRHLAWIEVPTDHIAQAQKPLTVTFTLAPLRSFAEALAHSRPPAPPLLPEETLGPGRYSRGWDRLWFIEPNTVTWSNLPLRQAGDYTLWIQLRHSERGPQETELTKHYQITLDGRALTFEWVRLDAWHTGNGYFGWAKATVGPLPAGLHTLNVTTTHPWCALLPRMWISRDASFTP